MIKVVIADDQELIRESLKIVLGTHEDIQVVNIAADGLEVLDILKRESVLKRLKNSILILKLLF